MSPLFGLDYLMDTLDDRSLIHLYNEWRREYNLSNRGYFRQNEGIIINRNNVYYASLNKKLIPLKDLRKYIKDNVLQVHSW